MDEQQSEPTIKSMDDLQDGAIYVFDHDDSVLWMANRLERGETILYSRELSATVRMEGDRLFAYEQATNTHTDTGRTPKDLIFYAPDMKAAQRRKAAH